MITSAAVTMTARAEDEKDVAMLTLQVSDQIEGYANLPMYLSGI
jgi:hypothetical protein